MRRRPRNQKASVGFSARKLFVGGIRHEPAGKKFAAMG